MEHDTLLRVSRCAEKTAKARSELDQAIVNAKDAGHSLRLIAQLAGMSHESVRQVLRKKGGEKQQ